MNSPRTPQASLSSELKNIINDRNILTTRTRMKVLSALDEIHQESTAQKLRQMRMQAINEILTSEVTYLHQLELIMQFFMSPMIEKNLMNHSLYTTLFRNIETLYNVNGELLRELKQHPENVARAFYRLAPFFKLYSVYAYDYKQALILLQETQQRDPTTAAFIARQETRPEVSKKLSSLLIAPIQRIPRYRLLLKEVLQYTPIGHKDHNILRASLVEIEKAAIHINTLVAEYEDTQKLLELQKHIVSPINLVKPGRKLIRQGPLLRVSRRGSSSYRRHFVLLNDTLMYCKGDPENALTVCCLLPLNKCKVQRVLSGGLFKVSCLQEDLLLYSENGDSEAWIQSLQDSVKKYVECRQTLRKDSSSRKPLRNNDVNQFPSESIPEKRCKRKRSENDDPGTTDSNTSDIIYVNQDHEDEGGSEETNECFSFRNFKKLRFSNTSKNDKRKLSTNSLKSQEHCTFDLGKDVSYMDSLYPLRRDVERYDIPNNTNGIAQGSTVAAKQHLKNDLNAIEEVRDNLPTVSVQKFELSHKSPTEHPEQQRQSTFKVVNEFFSMVGSSLRDFFRLK